MAYKMIIDAIKNMLPHCNKEEKSHTTQETLYCEKYKELVAKYSTTLDEYLATLDEYSTAFTEIEKLHKELERFKKRNIELSQGIIFLMKDEINIAQIFLDAPTNENGDVVLAINREETEAIKKNFEDCLNKKSK